jgi:hypothetical protein
MSFTFKNQVMKIFNLEKTDMSFRPSLMQTYSPLNMFVF